MAGGGLLMTLLVLVGILLLFPVVVYGVSQWIDLGFVGGITGAFKKVFSS